MIKYNSWGKTNKHATPEGKRLLWPTVPFCTLGRRDDLIMGILKDEF